MAEQDALNEFMQMLETTSRQLQTHSCFSFPSQQVPEERVKLDVLVSKGKPNEALVSQLTHEMMKRLSNREVKKNCKRYEAYDDRKTTETLLASKAIGMVVKVDDEEALQKDLQEDFVINSHCTLWLDIWYCTALPACGFQRRYDYDKTRRL